MFSYVGTTDFRVICARMAEGDAACTAAYEALVYQLAKDIGAMAAVLHFDVDAIVYTGGPDIRCFIAFSTFLFSHCLTILPCTSKRI